jgi:hypothetical protein
MAVAASTSDDSIARIVKPCDPPSIQRIMPDGQGSVGQYRLDDG